MQFSRVVVPPKGWLWVNKLVSYVADAQCGKLCFLSRGLTDFGKRILQKKKKKKKGILEFEFILFRFLYVFMFIFII